MQAIAAELGADPTDANDRGMAVDEARNFLVESMPEVHFGMSSAMGAGVPPKQSSEFNPTDYWNKRQQWLNKQRKTEEI